MFLNEPKDTTLCKVPSQSGRHAKGTAVSLFSFQGSDLQGPDETSTENCSLNELCGGGALAREAHHGTGYFSLETAAMFPKAFVYSVGSPQQREAYIA